MRKNETIFFREEKDGFIVRLDDTEVNVFCDKTRWYLDWIIYSLKTTCFVDWWCHKKNCDLDELGMEEWCAACPRETVDDVEEFSSNSNEYRYYKAVENLEELRGVILNDYEKLAHNGLHHQNLRKIMYSTWDIAQRSPQINFIKKVL